MATRTAPAPRLRLLPDPALDWLKKRTTELAGGLCAALALWLLLALVSWEPTDPSFNRAADGAVLNLAGRAGAYGGEAMLAWFGLAAGLPVLVLAAWARRLLVRHRLPRPVLSALLTPVAMVLIGLALALLGWPRPDGLPAGAAGLIGGLTAIQLVELPWLATVPPALPGLLALILGLTALVFAMALPWRDVTTAARTAQSGSRMLAGHISAFAPVAADAARGSLEWLKARRLGQIDEREDIPAGSQPPEEDEDWEEEDEAEEAVEESAPAARGRAEPRLTGRASAPEKTTRVAPRQDVEKPKKKKKPVQTTFAFEPGEGFVLPPMDLLSEVDQSQRKKVDEEGLEQNARMLESVLNDFGIRGEIVDVRPGPVVTLYELEPEAGIRASRVIGLADDIARNMSAVSARVAVVPGRTVLGIELPNVHRETVALRELLEDASYTKGGPKLPIALGKEISGVPVVEDLAMMPHLLVAGTTGSGKSVAVNAMILSLLYKLTPEECRLILIDPKMLELSVYDDIPHLLAPVVTEPGKAVMALKWTVREMENRYRSMQKVGVRNIDGFNKRVAEADAKGLALTRTVQTGFNAESGEPVFEEEVIADKKLPYIVVVVDEMADLMLVAGRDIEGAIQRLAQMARAAGIHIVMATQRPSVDVITGTIKANFPSRVSFHVTSKIDSRTILGDQGAEQLLGKGDMLFMRGGGRVTRIHGPFVGDDEVQQVTAYLRSQGKPDYIESITEETFENAMEIGGFDSGSDGKEQQLYDQAVFLVTREQKASTSFIQRHLKIGYNRAASIIEQMEREGVVSPANHVGKREVLAGAPPER
jgi:DNA segregation ATPase FtsK/SpoIIIE, S-DNA-T family